MTQTAATDVITSEVEEEARDQEVKEDNVTESGTSDIEGECLEYETVGRYYISEVTDVREKELEGRQNKLLVEVDVPFGDRVLEYDKPYTWEGEFPEVAETHGYGRGNFQSLDGERVVLLPDADGNWEMVSETQHSIRQVVAEENSLTFRERYNNAILYVLVMSGAYLIDGVPLSEISPIILGMVALTFSYLVYEGWKK